MNVITPDLAAAPSEPFGPARITHWSSAASLDLLGTYWMTFDATGESDPWTLSYEESVFVVDGDAWFVELDGEGERTVHASRGELTVIRKGTTVRYGGKRGTRLLISIAPVHWESGS